MSWNTFQKKSISKHIKENVYITIDLDVLDPSEMPSVGTPEPGGMRYTMKMPTSSLNRCYLRKRKDTTRCSTGKRC